MFKVILNSYSSRLIRCLPIQRVSFHVSQTTINTQDYDISEDFVDIADERKTKVPYQKYVRPNLTILTKKLVRYLDCSNEQVKTLLKENKSISKIDIPRLSTKLEFLFEKKINPKTILENSWLLELPAKTIEDKLRILKVLDGKDVNDFAPLIRNSPSQIKKINTVFRKEKDDIPEGNRIYYFAAKLQVEPMIVSKYFSYRMFMFEISLDQLMHNLDAMLEYEMTPTSILRDLWGFKYLPISIRSRLERCRSASKDNLKPWIIRCPEDILERTLELAKDHKELLGDKQMNEYIAERLGYDISIIDGLLVKNRQILKIKPSNVKNVLDYLLNEEGFAPYQIANVIRVLVHSLETTKKRIDELKSYGCRPSSLNILTKSNPEYMKFLQAWIIKKEMLEKKKK